MALDALAQQSWRFAALVGLGFMALSMMLRWYLDDPRDGLQLALLAVGSAIVLLANRSVIIATRASSFLILLGAGTLLFLLGAIAMHALNTRPDVAPDELVEETDEE